MASGLQCRQQLQMGVGSFLGSINGNEGRAHPTGKQLSL
jgi:hypothetical protein